MVYFFPASSFSFIIYSWRHPIKSYKNFLYKTKRGRKPRRRQWRRLRRFRTNPLNLLKNVVIKHLITNKIIQQSLLILYYNYLVSAFPIVNFFGVMAYFKLRYIIIDSEHV